MFVRSITTRTKPDIGVEGAIQLMETRILPLLAKRKGFRDAMVLTSHEGNETLAISIWDSREDAEAYQRETLGEVQRIMADFVEGTPQLKTYNLSFSTIHRASASGA